MGVIREVSRNQYCLDAVTSRLTISSSSSTRQFFGDAPLTVVLIENQPKWTTVVNVLITQNSNNPRYASTDWRVLKYNPWFTGPVTNIYPDFQKSVVVVFDANGVRYETGYILPILRYRSFRYNIAPPAAQYSLRIEDKTQQVIGNMSLGSSQTFEVDPFCGCSPGQIQCGSTPETICCIDCTKINNKLEQIKSRFEVLANKQV